MSDSQTHSRVGVFLSYAREDNDILLAVNSAFEGIRQKTRQQLEIFYDRKSIDAGDIFDYAIREALQNSDYLVILYTGAYKQSHSYTGFEVGYFVSLMDDEMKKSENTSRQIVSMFVDEPPATTKTVQGIPLTISASELSSDRDIYMQQVRANVDNDPLTKFFITVADEVEKRFPKYTGDDETRKKEEEETLRKERLERFQAVQKIVPVLRGDMYDYL